MARSCYDFADKLIRSLNSSYEVIDRPMVLECITYFEQEKVTKTFLEETRLGKYVNELRRRTKDESLAKRTRELVRKWRHQLIPDTNTLTLPATTTTTTTPVSVPSTSSSIHNVDQNNLKVTNNINNNNLIYVNNNNKRPFNDDTKTTVVAAKKPRRNGKLKTSDSLVTSSSTTINNDCDDIIILSDSIQSIPKTPVCLPSLPQPPQQSNTTTASSASVVDSAQTVAVTAIVSSSSSSDEIVDGLSPPPPPPPPPKLLADTEPVKTTVDSQPQQQQQPIASIIIVDDEDEVVKGSQRQRSRSSKASRTNNVNDPFSKLLAAANKKCKTTEEIVGQLNNRSILQTSEIKKMDPPVAMAKLRKEIEKIDAQLNPAIQKSVNEIPKWRPKKNGLPTVIEIESDEDEDGDDRDAVVLIDPAEEEQKVAAAAAATAAAAEQVSVWKMPPIDYAQYERDLCDEEKYACVCPEPDENEPDTPLCPVADFLNVKYNRPHEIDNRKLNDLHYKNVSNLNGNWGVYVQPVIDLFPQLLEPYQHPLTTTKFQETEPNNVPDVYANIVPDLYTDRLPKNIGRRRTNGGSGGVSDGGGGGNEGSGQQTNESSSNVPCLSPQPQPQSSNLEAETAAASTGDNNLPTSLFPNSRHSAQMQFIEFHQCVDMPSYNDELLRILPYVIID